MKSRIHVTKFTQNTIFFWSAIGLNTSLSLLLILGGLTAREGLAFVIMVPYGTACLVATILFLWLRSLATWIFLVFIAAAPHLLQIYFLFTSWSSAENFWGGVLLFSVPLVMLLFLKPKSAVKNR